jgi:dipeptidase E
MKLLLTSAGIANDSIRDALVDLLGRPVEEATAVLIPTAIYALPDGPADAWEMARYVGDMGWKRLGIIELTALPTVEEDHWLPAVEAPTPSSWVAATPATSATGSSSPASPTSCPTC